MRRAATSSIRKQIQIPRNHFNRLSNNWLRLGFGEDDLARRGSNRFLDAIVAWGGVDPIRSRVRAHHHAGADHECIQVLPADPRALPLPEWRRLAPALLER